MRNVSVFTFVILTITLLFSCTENNVKPEDKISEFYNLQPDSALCGDTIAINGKNISITQNPKIYFDTLEAELISISKSQIKFIVPKIDVGAYNLKIVSDTSIFVFNNKFKVLYKPSVFDSIKYYEINYRLYGILKYDSYTSYYPDSWEKHSIDSVNTGISYTNLNKKTNIVRRKDTITYSFKKGYEELSSFSLYYGASNIENKINFSFNIWERLEEPKGYSFKSYYGDHSYCLNMNDVPYRVENNVVIVEIKGREIDKYLISGHFGQYQIIEFSGHHDSRISESLSKLLPSKEDSYIRIKFYK